MLAADSKPRTPKPWHSARRRAPPESTVPVLGYNAAQGPLPEDGISTTSATSIRTQARRANLFYSTVASILAASVFVGFARSYYLKQLFHSPQLSWLLHLHGLVMTGWIILFIVQTRLVAARRTDIHRRLGVGGAVLASAMVVIGVSVAITAARLGHAPPPATPLAFLVVPLGDMVLFGTLVSAAMYYRRRPELHKRLMLIATLAITPAAIARWPFAFLVKVPFFFFVIADLFLIACALYDYRKTRRLNPAYLWGGLLLIVSHPLRIVLSGTGLWMSFAHWITRT